MKQTKTKKLIKVKNKTNIVIDMTTKNLIDNAEEKVKTELLQPYQLGILEGRLTYNEIIWLVFQNFLKEKDEPKHEWKPL